MLELNAKIRKELGSKNNKIRKQGMIPAVLYGPKVENLNLMVDYNNFRKIYQKAGESTLIKLKLKNGKDLKDEERVVLINDMVRDVMSDKITHIDFYQVRMDQEITVEVPLAFIGESEAVKSLDGVLVKSLQSVNISALPTDLIHEIEIDISGLKTFDDIIRIKDLKVPEKVKIEADLDEAVVSVAPPRSEEELEALEQTPEETIEEVEVEEKGKKETEEVAAETEPDSRAESEEEK